MSYTISEYVSTFLHIGSEYEPHTCSYICNTQLLLKIYQNNKIYTHQLTPIAKFFCNCFEPSRPYFDYIRVKLFFR